jgi:hypothetical protein
MKQKRARAAGKDKVLRYKPYALQIRLSAGLAQDLAHAAKSAHLTKSEWVRRAITYGCCLAECAEEKV